MKNIFLILLSFVFMHVHAQKNLTFSLLASYSPSMIVQDSVHGGTYTSNDFGFEIQSNYFNQENIFWGGISLSYQNHDFDAFSSKVTTSTCTSSAQLKIGMHEFRTGIKAGLNLKEQRILPFIGLNYSFLPFAGFSAHSSSSGTGVACSTNINPIINQYKKSLLVKSSPSIEIGCEFITRKIISDRFSLHNHISLRYHPLSVFQEGMNIIYTDLNGDLISYKAYGKLLTLSYAVGIQTKKFLRKN